MTEGFVRLSRENIDLKAQVLSLEETISALRTEVQKTHVHIHNVVGGTTSSGNQTPRTANNSNGGGKDAKVSDSEELQKLKDEIKAHKLKLHEAELREKDLIVALRVSDMASVITNQKLPEEVQVAMLRIQNSWKNARLPEDLSADKSHKVVCSVSATTDSTINTTNGKSDVPNLDALSQQLTEKDNEIGNLYVSLQELESARDTLTEQLEEEKKSRSEAEDHWRESHESATAYYEESEQLKAQLASLQAELDAVKNRSSHKDPEDGSISMSFSQSPSSPATIPSKYENLITARVEEETFLLREDHENEVETLREKLKANEDKVKLISLELGKAQLEIRKLKSNGTTVPAATTTKGKIETDTMEEWSSEAPVLPQQSGQVTPISSVSRRLELADSKKPNSAVDTDFQQQLAAAIASKEIALSVKEEALREVKELTRKLHRLEVQLLSDKDKAGGSKNASLSSDNVGVESSSSWAEQLMKSKDEQIFSYQRRVAEAEAENKFSQQRLIDVQQEASKQKQQSEQVKAELEAKIKALEKKILVFNTNINVTSPGRGVGNNSSNAPLSPTSSISDAILMSKLSTGGNSGNSGPTTKINSNVGATFISDSTKSFKERILMKRLLLQQQQQQQQQQNPSAGNNPHATVTASGASHKQWTPPSASATSGNTQPTMTHDETVQCVDSASDKAEVIAQRLQRALRAKLLSSTEHPTSKDSSDASAAEFVTSAATSDFLSELIADALLDYEVKLKHLQNEVLSYQTIISVKEADAEEERKNATRLLNDEFENFRVAKMIQEEEQAAKRTAMTSSPSRAQRKDLSDEELHKQYQRQFGGN